MTHVIEKKCSQCKDCIDGEEIIELKEFASFSDLEVYYFCGYDCVYHFSIEQLSLSL